MNEESRLRTIKEKVEKNLEDVPEGRLRIGKSQGCVQYYHCKNDGEHNGVYLSKKEKNLVRRLAQKTYDEKILKCVEKRISQIGRILKDYQDDEIEKIYLKEHMQRRKLIVPVEMTFQQRLDKWLSESYVGKEFNDASPVILTNKGMRVRSKSEKIMADYFDSMGINYKYECPLKLNQYTIIYPDFTFLSPVSGEKVYWEHQGMMDNPEYARKAVKKIELYENNGIFSGENLILTFETSISVINMNIVKELVEKYLVCSTTN